MAAVQSVELGTYFVLRVFTDRMAGKAFFERLFAGSDIIRAARTDFINSLPRDVSRPVANAGGPGLVSIGLCQPYV
jgi:hypothetical protein